CYDALSALMIERAGFAAAYLSGASIAYTRLGRPDVGLVSLSELAETVGLIRDRVALPLIVDADTGFGNALNVQRTVRLLGQDGCRCWPTWSRAGPRRFRMRVRWRRWGTRSRSFRGARCGRSRGRWRRISRAWPNMARRRRSGSGCWTSRASTR